MFSTLLFLACHSLPWPTFVFCRSDRSASCTTCIKGKIVAPVLVSNMWVLPSCCHGSWVHQSQTLVFWDLTPYIFSSKRWFFQKYFFDIIYLLYHNLLTKLFIIIPYVAHNEGRTFIYLEHFLGSWLLRLGATPWRLLWPSRLPCQWLCQAPYLQWGLSFMGRELANLVPGFGNRRQGLRKKEKGEMDINLSLILIPPPKKKHVARKESKAFRKWFWQRSITRYHKVFMATFLLNWLHSLVAYYFLLKIDRFVRGHGRQTKDTDMYERRWHLAIGMQMHAKLHPFRQPGMQQWSRLWSLSHVLLGEMANDYCLNTARTSQTCLLHPETT